jgi:hypothetical protein
MLVVSHAVGTNLFKRAALVDAPIAIYHVVIANRSEASGLVPACDVLDSEVSAFTRGSTVNDDFINLTHDDNLLFDNLPFTI